MTNIEKFSAKELALAMFDCINNDNQKNLVVFEDNESYEKEFQGLMQAHHEAPISGVQAMDFAAGLITFNNNSELWFSVSKSDDSETDIDEEEETTPESPPENLDEFLGEFEVS